HQGINVGGGAIALDGVWDLGITGEAVPGTSALQPVSSLLTSLTGFNGENYNTGSNITGDPQFVRSYQNTLQAAATLDEGGNNISVRFTELNTELGDYHIGATSLAVENGATVSATELSSDYDGEVRPVGLTDIGADEVPGATPPPFALLTPNGGETLFGGTQTTVTWNPLPGAATYNLRVSFGGNFFNIATGLSGNSFVWNVPNVNQSSVTMRVVAYGAGGQWLGRDDSDATFTIVKGGTLLTPNNGETLTGGTVYRITWTAHPAADNYRLRLSLNGNNFFNIADNVVGTSFDWVVPNWNIASAVIRVVSKNGPAWVGADDSDVPFVITKP
ncbi:MAG: hypothetical protein D6706_16230, partial [Chloroflexi bacterium]